MTNKYKKASAIFKQNNFDLYDWLLSEAEREDISVSAFIIRSLKKIREIRDENTKEQESGNLQQVR